MQRQLQDVQIYDSKSAESPFMAFLKATNEKTILANKISNIVACNRPKSTENLNILDIGCGDGSMSSMYVKALQNKFNQINFTGIDPVKYNVSKAIENFKTIKTQSTFLINTYDHNFFESQKFDLIIASNLYYLDIAEIPEFINQTSELLSQTGIMLFIYRGPDDQLLEFRNLFERMIYGEYRKPRTMNDVIKTCNKDKLHYQGPISCNSKLSFPKNKQAKDKIIEFILNRDIVDIDRQILELIYHYICKNDGNFKTTQQIIIVKNPQVN